MKLLNILIMSLGMISESWETQINCNECHNKFTCIDVEDNSKSLLPASKCCSGESVECESKTDGSTTCGQY